MTSANSVVDEATVAIIGGGVIGCSAAYHLAKSGITNVVILERGQLSGGATARAAGLVCHARSDESTTRMINRTRQAILELEALLDEKLDFHQVGSIRAVMSDTRALELATMEACLNAAGVEFQTMDAAGARTMCPWLELGEAQRIVYTPADGYIDGARLGMAYSAAARQLGARVRRGVTVSDLLVDGNRVTGVVTDQGVVRADWVVAAAGVWGAAVSAWLGWGFAASPTRSPIGSQRRMAAAHRDGPTCICPTCGRICVQKWAAC
jgi:sarcosine oxidase subunit beta